MIARLASALLLALLASQVAHAARLVGYAGGAALNFDLGGDTVNVPDCSGLAEAACVSAVEGEGFVASVVSACSATVAMGDVIATAPPGGSSAESGSTVVIRVSNGEECKNGQGSRLGLGLGVTR